MLFSCLFLSYQWLFLEATALGFRSALQTEHILSAQLMIFDSSSAEIHLQCGENVHFQTYKEMNVWLISLHSMV